MPVRTVLLLILSAMLQIILESNPSIAGWESVNTRVVLEKKVGPWKASWIFPGPDLHSDAVGRCFYLRKEVQVEDPRDFSRVYVSADSQYKMWINGEPVARGPARFDPNHQVYDTLDLSSSFHEGKNTVAVEVMYWGSKTQKNPYFQISVHPAFVFDSETLCSDDTWKVLVGTGCEGAGDSTRKRAAAHWFEKVDGGQIPIGWNEADFDDSAWLQARVLADAERWGEQTDTSSPWKLIPRSIPAPEEHPPIECSAIQSGRVLDEKERPPFSFEVSPDSASPSLPYTIPGDGRLHYLVFQAERLVNGYVSLDMEGIAGSVVEVMYSEAPSIDWQKGRRDTLGDRRVEGCNDTYLTRDGRQVYEPFLHRTFWYVRVAVKTETPLTIHSLSYRWTGYPFTERGRFSCSDKTLNRIWEVGWYTQRMCAYDTFQDCPYYERLQYAGDVRIQALVTLYASGDTALIENSIRQLYASSIPEGLMQSRYPNNVFQVIPPFSLYWIQILEDYYLHTGDIGLVRECSNGITSILRFFENHLNENGFISDLPYWNFYDWTFEKKGVPDAHWENCTLTTIHFKGALDSGRRLMEALGDDLEAERYTRLSKGLKEGINRLAWSEKEGLYYDGIKTQTLSQHVNAFAVLFDVATEDRKQRIAERLFDDGSLRGTTFFFAHFVHEVALVLNQPERVIGDFDRWKSMLDLGTSTWWETPGNPRSECHAWSATPTYRLMELVLGVRPLKPGFSEVEIRPYPGDLDWAEGVVPTPHGDIRVGWKREPRFEIEIDLPEDMEADVVFPNGSKARAQSGHSLLLCADPGD